MGRAPKSGTRPQGTGPDIGAVEVEVTDVSTYQAGKVILVRTDGNALNTHFRTFAKPMGIAADQHRLTVGGSNTVWDYRNMPAVAQKLEPAGKHDACYLPRRVHVTGDIDIHELAYTREHELWLVNTRFCCLCTLDAEHSFVPRWRPPFVSALAPEDRCHLNGLCMVDGRPKYVTAQAPYLDVQTIRRRKANTAVLPPSPHRRVGIVWAGSPTHANDRHRSCPLPEWLPVLQTPHTAFYSLQKDGSSRGLAELSDGCTLQDLDPLLGDYGDLTLLIDQLDLVISVDTSVAHVAGALGRPVWTLLSYVPDWRWLLEGEITPWYPTMRLFRQGRPGDWAGVMTRVAAALPASAR